MPSRFSVPRHAPFFTKTLQIGACPRINANNKGVFPSISGAFNGYLGIDSMNNSQIAAAVLSSTTRHSSCKGFRPFKFAASALILDSVSSSRTMDKWPPHQAYAIRCFKCLVTEEVSFANEEENLPNITPACSKFDSSSKFIVECPYSTMCMKTISTMYLQYGLEQNTITRGCAPQKSSTLVFRNGNWHKEDSVKDVYVEECRLINENVLAASVRTYVQSLVASNHPNVSKLNPSNTLINWRHLLPQQRSKSEHKIARLPRILRNVHTTPKVQADEINVPPAIGSKPNGRFEGPQDLYISTEATPKQYPLPYRSNQVH
ncbi:hypothetical protein GQX74_000777 [Glossina fuscipes]|nr:hypothetical protein GQX74_000777 [Glossina fuscipes]